MNLRFLFIAYSLIWLCLVYLLLSMAKKLTAAQNKLEQLQGN
jgi:hypothetical protein